MMYSMYKLNKAEWQYTALTYYFSNLEPFCCSMSVSNCCFLTCLQISQEAGKVFWYSHLFKNFPQLVVIHTVKGFCSVNDADFFFFWNLHACFFYEPTDVDNLISAFSKSSLCIWQFSVHVQWKPSLKEPEHISLLACELNVVLNYSSLNSSALVCAVVWTFFGIALSVGLE